MTARAFTLIGIAVLTARASAATPTPNYQPVSVGTYGKACRLNGGAKLGPPSYRVADIGKPGVPNLTADQRAMVHRIEKYVGDFSLWFAFVRNSFTVFNTSEDQQDKPPCSYEPLGYVVENDPCDCYYQSGEEDSITLGPGDTPEPKPWFTARPGP